VIKKIEVRRRDLKEFILSYVGDKEKIIHLDIGAYDAHDTEQFMVMNKNIFSYIFEPDERNIAKISLRRMDKRRYELFNCVVSDKDEDIDFYKSKLENNKRL